MPRRHFICEIFAVETNSRRWSPKAKWIWQCAPSVLLAMMATGSHFSNFGNLEDAIACNGIFNMRDAYELDDRARGAAGLSATPCIPCRRSGRCCLGSRGDFSRCKHGARVESCTSRERPLGGENHCALISRRSSARIWSMRRRSVSRF